MFTVYVLERVLYRISLSRYIEHFVLKGGILLYGLFNEQYARTTTDIDLLGCKISNDAESMKTVFNEILNIECDDAIRFDLDSLNAKSITEFKKYHGVQVSLTAYLDRTKIPVSIDVGYDDVIYPEKQRMEYPTVLDDEPPVLYAYSIESIIAEKFEAIVSLGRVNSRYKDFYDIYTLAKRFDFSGEILKQALTETLEHRGTSLDRIVAFEKGFADDSFRKSRWAGFVKSKHADTNLSLQDTIDFIRKFLSPVVNSIKEDNVLNMCWNHHNSDWQ